MKTTVKVRTIVKTIVKTIVNVSVKVNVNVQVEVGRRRAFEGADSRRSANGLQEAFA